MEAPRSLAKRHMAYDWANRAWRVIGKDCYYIRLRRGWTAFALEELVYFRASMPNSLQPSESASLDSV